MRSRIEIDEEVRKLIETAHTEAWEVLNAYRDVLDDLVVELLDKETLNRKDLKRIFSRVEKRPRLTAFNDFGGRVPSDKPPVKTRAELAKERGESWPPVQEQPPTPVGTMPGAGDLPGGPPHGNGNPLPTPNGSGPSGVPGYGDFPQQPGQYGRPTSGQPGGQPASGDSHQGPPNYGQPFGWMPVTSPSSHSAESWRSSAWESPGGEKANTTGVEQFPEQPPTSEDENHQR